MRQLTLWAPAWVDLHRKIKSEPFEYDGPTINGKPWPGR